MPKRPQKPKPPPVVTAPQRPVDLIIDLRTTLATAAGRPMTNDEQQDLTAIIVRLCPADRQRLLEILTNTTNRRA